MLISWKLYFHNGVHALVKAEKSMFSTTLFPTSPPKAFKALEAFFPMLGYIFHDIVFHNSYIETLEMLSVSAHSHPRNSSEVLSPSQTVLEKRLLFAQILIYWVSFPNCFQFSLIYELEGCSLKHFVPFPLCFSG